MQEINQVRQVEAAHTQQVDRAQQARDAAALTLNNLERGKAHSIFLPELLCFHPSMRHV